MTSTDVTARIKRRPTASRSRRDALEKLARAGYVTKGVVYAIVGVLAVQVATGSGGRLEGSRGAVQAIARQPFGRALLVLTTIGLASYVIWRFIQAIWDVERKGSDARGIIKRLGYAASGLVYAALAQMAGRVAFGQRAGSGDAEQQWTTRLMAQPAGPWLVALAGAIVLGIGLYQFYRVYRLDFMKSYDLGRMSHRERRFARRAGQWGLSARGVTFSLIGWFLIQAAIRHDPDRARGLGAALATLRAQPYGPWLLGLVALGLVAFGAYCFTNARFRHFRTHLAVA
ncbi:MAG TPA: DUF1206 domain-containing protein [Haliangium sp.]|nr:DUF1206 domain-containing protein [Haliangium sp.]